MDAETKLRLAKLDALEAGGVDNWEFYDASLSEWHKAAETHDIVEEIIEFINDALVEAGVEEPAGSGCGYAIHYDDDAVRNYIWDKLTQIQ